MNINHGYFGIGIYHTKMEVNVGTLIRSAYSFGASFVFTVGKRYKKQASSVNSDRHIPVFHFKTIEEMKKSTPFNSRLIAIEISNQSKGIKNFVHPERAVYLLGAEDHGIHEKLLRGFEVIQLPGRYCLNVAVAGSIVMFDRINKL